MDITMLTNGKKADVNNNYVEGNKSFNDKVITIDGERIFEGSMSNEHMNMEDIEKSVEKINKLFEDKDISVEYEIYGKFKDITIKIINNKTKEVIKEIPPKKIIDMVDKLCELAGMFLDEKA